MYDSTPLSSTSATQVTDVNTRKSTNNYKMVSFEHFIFLKYNLILSLYNLICNSLHGVFVLLRFSCKNAMHRRKHWQVTYQIRD